MLWAIITIYMPYYPNSSFSKPLTDFVRSDSAFMAQWGMLARHGAISCNKSVCTQNGAAIKNPLIKKMSDSEHSMGFDLYITPDMYNNSPSVYVNKNSVDVPIQVTEAAILKIAANFNIVRGLARQY